jgi:fructose transport system permease protein
MQEQTTGQMESNRFESGLPSEDPTVAVFEEGDRGALRRVQHFLHAYPTTIPFFVLVLSVVIFSMIVGGRFFAPLNLSLVLQQVTIIAVLGIAQTLIILTAGIDLSVGAIMVLSSIVMGRLAVVNGVPVELAFPIGLVTGIACGAVNGTLVTRLKLPPFIVTLGTWSIFNALVLFYSRSETLRQQDVEAVASFLQWTGYALNDGLRDAYGYLKLNMGSESWPEWAFRFGGARITYGSILMIIIAAVVWYILTRTAFGRHVYATGDDPDAARLAGINTNRTLLAVYTIAGLICAIGGWILIGRIGAVSPLGGQTANLDSITAVVIGGTSLFGGRGSIVGTLIGALIVGVFRNGLALAGLDALWQEFAVGVLIIVAVALDQWIRRVSL